MKKILIPVILATALCLGACAKKETPKMSMPPTPAQLVKAQDKNVAAYISTLGTTASLKSVNIVPQVSGQITKINFKQGDSVKAGQILATIDNRPYQASLKQAEGNLRQAQAQLKIDELQVERNKKLAKQNYVDKQTFDTLLAKVEIDKGLIESYKGALETAKINLNWCDIQAPVDGKVGLYNINEGNIVSAGNSVITSVETLDKLFVDFVIPSQRLYDAMNKMKANGGKLNINVSYIEDNMTDRNRAANVNIVLNKIRYETGTAVLRGELDNADFLFWPNQPVKVVVDMDEIKDGVLVPEICIQTNALGAYIYKATPFKDGVFIVKMLQVEKGQLYEGNMRLISSKEIKGGDYVVEQVSQLLLQAGPFVYMADENGMIIGADGKVITDPQTMKDFMMKAAKTTDELRAEMFKKAAVAAQAAQAPAEALKAAKKAAEMQPASQPSTQQSAAK